MRPRPATAACRRWEQLREAREIGIGDPRPVADHRRGRRSGIAHPRLSAAAAELGHARRRGRRQQPRALMPKRIEQRAAAVRCRDPHAKILDRLPRRIGRVREREVEPRGGFAGERRDGFIDIVVGARCEHSRAIEPLPTPGRTRDVRPLRLCERRAGESSARSRAARRRSARTVMRVRVPARRLAATSAPAMHAAPMPPSTSAAHDRRVTCRGPRPTPAERDGGHDRARRDLRRSRGAHPPRATRRARPRLRPQRRSRARRREARARRATPASRRDRRRARGSRARS